MFEKRPFLEFVERVSELGLGVHHYRAVPGDGFLKRLTRDEEEAGLDETLHGEQAYL